MTILICCQIDCQRRAIWGLLSEGLSWDMESHACDTHLAELLEPGESTVWPLNQLPHLDGEVITTTPASTT